MDSATFTTSAGVALADPIVWTSANGNTLSSWTSVNGFAIDNPTSVALTVRTTAGPCIIPAGKSFTSPLLRGATIEKVIGGTPSAAVTITITTW